MDQPLASWNDGKAKSDILAFVRAVTTPGDGFVPPAERIATFDNDGTLWCEKPMYVQADFVFRRWKAMVDADPAKATEQPYKAIVESDRAWLAGLLDHVPELVKGVTEAYDWITVEAFEDAVRAFFAGARIPTLGRPYTQVGYQPMVELVSLLRASDFKVFICTGGGRDFVRPVARGDVRRPARERDRVGHDPRVPRRQTSTAPAASNSRSTTARASPSTSGPAPGGCRYWPAATPTGTSRCWRRPASGSSSTTTTLIASSPTTPAPSTPSAKPRSGVGRS